MKKTTRAFWWKRGHPFSLLLLPVSWIYAAVAGRRMRRAAGARAGVPVLCVGNFTVGGTGKTPVAEALARAAREAGKRPGFLLRGYGGKVEGAVLVDPERHSFRDVGDEALMLSRLAPVAVSPARADAAALLEQAGVDFIIMDDGLQSGRLKPDFAVAVVDAKRGFGNGRCLPAGPLRAPLKVQFPKVDAVLLNGAGGAEEQVRQFARSARRPVEVLHQQPTSDSGEFAGEEVLAYAGIGDPEKFFATLEGLGARVRRAVALADHQPISEALARSLLADVGAWLPVTTAKDMARLQGGGGPAISALREKSRVVEISAVFDNPAMPAGMIIATLDAFRRRVEADRQRR
ncbi:tetraacyldisaccharide 4'-kinase [Martelella mediterranea]|uniref:tetraacyldisaccharide 4'-kinase n=1 Tax=Martelella mediterranea TaxID=293089 RepID=UPI001E42644A|nr:tetraacyldisaccharide 4'-kinase [Martelella mediterranea]MCD1632675.1 tetraacyldisaccharide 4'-kinase [Martelella mediterranea]